MKKLLHLFTCAIIWFFFINTAYGYQPFPDTGQTMCYDSDDRKVLEVSCDSIQPGDPYYGQDAHYQPRIPRSYTKLGQGGVVLTDNALHVYEGGPWIMTRDNVTGLIWEVETKRTARMSTYIEFIDAFNADNFGGFSDWRLPTIKELPSLVNIDGETPTIDFEWFPNTEKSDYLSSTSRKSSIYTYYSGVNFDVGTIGEHHMEWNPGKNFYVRAVRGGHSPSSSLLDNDNGTVTDHTTGLMWQKYTAPSQWTDVRYTWEQALVYAESLKLAGHTDWRLPNRNELLSLVDKSYYSPAIHPILESHTLSSSYWSSSTHSRFPSNTFGFNRTWGVSFSSGGTSSLVKVSWGEVGESHYVRAVRGGQDWTKGDMRIDIEPDGAVDAGAQWRIKGTTVWRNSGTIATVPIGNHIIEFKVVPGWRPEGTITVTVQANKTITATGFYLEQAGIMPGVMMLLLDEEE